MNAMNKLLISIVKNYIIYKKKLNNKQEIATVSRVAIFVSILLENHFDRIYVLFIIDNWYWVC